MLRRISIIVLVAMMVWLTTMHAVGQKQSIIVEEQKEDPAPKQAIETFTAEVTAYTSSVDETDDTPDITASGSKTHVGTIACPRRYAFGTKVEIEGKEYVCEDRMHIRFDQRFDIWMESKNEAILWGVQTLQVNIIK